MEKYMKSITNKKKFYKVNGKYIKTIKNTKVLK